MIRKTPDQWQLTIRGQLAHHRCRFSRVLLEYSLPKQASVNHRKAEWVTTQMWDSGRDMRYCRGGKEVPWEVKEGNAVPWQVVEGLS